MIGIYLLYGAALILSPVFIRICIIYIQWRFNPLWNLPGPRGKFFLVGEFFTIFKEPFFAPHSRWWKEYNYAPIMSYSSLFGSWSVIPTDPSIIQHILTAPSAKEPVPFYKNFYFFRDMVGDGLVTLEGSTWYRHRRILQPCFQTTLVQESLIAAVPSKVNCLIKSWKQSEGRVIDIYAHMSAITLDILGEVAFAHDFAALDGISKWAQDTSSEEIGEIQDPMMKALSNIFKPLMISIVINLMKLSFLHTFNRKRKNTKRLLDEAAESIIQSAKDNQSTKNTQSLIYMMLDTMAKDEGRGGRNSFTLQEMKDELKMFIIAGHETTSTLCYWAFYALGKHPDVQEKVLEDIKKHAPADDEEQIGLDSVSKMEYFLAFLNECLRLYSPAGMLIRFPSQTETWNGNIIPKKTRVTIPIYLLHRHPVYWTDPESFRPERWLSEEEMQKKHPFCFLPFSAGGRNCIGEKFARFEAQLILVNLIRKFDIRLVESIQHAELELRSSLTVKSKPKVEIVVKSR